MVGEYNTVKGCEGWRVYGGWWRKLRAPTHLVQHLQRARGGVGGWEGGREGGLICEVGWERQRSYQRRGSLAHDFFGDDGAERACGVGGRGRGGGVFRVRVGWGDSMGGGRVRTKEERASLVTSSAMMRIGAWEGSTCVRVCV